MQHRKVTTVQQYLDTTKRQVEDISRFQAVLRKARSMRAAAEQEAEHRYQEELEA